MAKPRRSVREALAGEYTAVVERLTRRRVVGHVSGVHADPDVCLEPSCPG